MVHRSVTFRCCDVSRRHPPYRAFPPYIDFAAGLTPRGFFFTPFRVGMTQVARLEPGPLREV